MKQKGLAPIFIIIFLGLIAGILILNRTRPNFLKKFFPQEPDIITVSQTEREKITYDFTAGEFKLEGNKIIYILDGKTEVFMENIPGDTQEIRVGPDKKSLHLKIAPGNSDKKVGIKRCLLLEFTLEKDDYLHPPPCINTNGGLSGGFIRSAGYFTYIVLDSPQKGYLVMEDLTTKQSKTLDLPTSVLAGFNFQQSESSKELLDNFQVQLFIRKDQKRYVYPQEDVKLERNKLVLVFGNLIVLLNTKDMAILDVKELPRKELSIVSNAFGLLNENPNPPYIVVEGTWEVTYRVAILDISGNSIEIVNTGNLNKLYSNYFVDFGIKQIEWYQDSIVLNYPHSEDITKKLPGDFINNAEEAQESEIENYINQAEEILKKDSTYQDIECSRVYAFNCSGLKEVVKYQFDSSGGLRKL